MVRPVLWHHDEMSMRHPKPVHDHADAQWRELRSHSAPNALRNDHNSLGCLIIEIREMVHVALWDYKAFTGSSWAQRHEGQDNIILKDDTCWGLPCNYLAENACHRAGYCEWAD